MSVHVLIKQREQIWKTMRQLAYEGETCGFTVEQGNTFEELCAKLDELDEQLTTWTTGNDRPALSHSA